MNILWKLKKTMITMKFCIAINELLILWNLSEILTALKYEIRDNRR